MRIKPKVRRSWIVAFGYMIAMTCSFRKDGEPKSRQTAQHDFYCMMFQGVYYRR